MGKISQVSAKYIIHSSISIEGVVDKPDIIGAVFGQTEGLLGSDLELRELQRNGRIGRIEVNSEVRGGKTSGDIQVPSSLDKSETCIVGAALEIIQRIGPCNARLRVQKIEDIRVSKREQVVTRAKELLHNLVEGQMPDSQEIADEVAYSVRVMEITGYGKEQLPAGPAIDDSDEIIVVEGRADVLNLLKYGFKNAIAMNGTSVPQTIIDLSKEKTITVFVDGDRGGDLIVRELGEVGEVDFVTKAPDGKEVEEITKKEINKALRAKIAFEQVKLDTKVSNSKKPVTRAPTSRPIQRPVRSAPSRDARKVDRPVNRPVRRTSQLSDKEKEAFKTMSDELVGTRGAFILDENLNMLGKVPVAELASTVKSLRNGIHAVIMDGEVDKDVAEAADASRVKFLVGTDCKLNPRDVRTTVVKAAEL